MIAIFLFSGRENIRLFFLLALPVVFAIDKAMKPPRPDGAPTPMEIIKRSTGLRYFLAVYMLGAAVLAVISISVSSVGSWLSSNPWLVFPLVGVPIGGLILLSEIALYKAYGETEP
ncbi:MAG: hypothetical protein ACYC1T_09600 [Sulfuricaulis sp.]